ncbi:MAG: glycosyltransferase family 4 protein [Pseudomonadota bacterium]
MVPKQNAVKSFKGKLAVLYHYMHPDDVVSALHFDGLSQDLAADGWDVEAFPCNRGCRDEIRTYVPSEIYKNVKYHRISRPRFQQASFVGRLLNSSWMIAKWTTLAFRSKGNRPDVIIVGTDPVFGALVAIPLRLFAPNTKLVHWCFDMHPEAAVVSGAISNRSPLLIVAKAAMKLAYRRYDVIVDIGSCMRERLRAYGHHAAEHELTPWAIVEPDSYSRRSGATRNELFGDARLGVLYSGNFGEAHDFDEFLQLARRLRCRSDIRFCFAVRGNRADALRKAVTKEDKNVFFASFAPVEQLETRLGSADIHLASLRHNWAGVAVPSKFFGSLASGRPILYAGPTQSAIANWIERFDIGWHLTEKSTDQVAEALCVLAENPEKLTSLHKHCFQTYAEHFSRAKITGEWNQMLDRTLHKAG